MARYIIAGLVIVAILYAMASIYDPWHALPWGPESYMEPTLIERTAP